MEIKDGVKWCKVDRHRLALSAVQYSTADKFTISDNIQCRIECYKTNLVYTTQHLKVLTL